MHPMYWVRKSVQDLGIDRWTRIQDIIAGPTYNNYHAEGARSTNVDVQMFGREVTFEPQPVSMRARFWKRFQGGKS